MLNGTFPKETTYLSSLQSVSLTKNHMSGTLPSELGRLVALTFLDLQYNQLTGGLPVNWLKLSALRHLNLAWNPLSIGTIDSDIQYLSKLENLFWDDVGLTGTIPVEIFELTGLSKFLSRILANCRHHSPLL